MKRTLISLASLALVGTATAQSSVTMFGVMDTAVAGYRNQSETPSGTTVTTSKSALTSPAFGRLGFRGTEDLGGGLAASFWLEAGISTNTGTGAAVGGGLDFNRRSTVSLSGGAGELRLGRDYTPTFWNDTVFDPFNTIGVGASLISTASGGTSLGVPNSGFQSNANYVRASNSVQYFLPPNLGGFYGQFMYAFNGHTSYDPGTVTPPGANAVIANPALFATADNARAGRYVGARVGYATGPLDVALAYGASTIGSNYFAGATTNLDIWNLGASYDFGVVKLFGEYSNNKQNTALVYNQLNAFGVTKPGANGGLLGITIPIGPGLIRATYTEVKYNNLPVATYINQPKADQVAVGYVYNFSRRTSVFATFSYLSDKDGASLALQGGTGFYAGPVPGSVGTAVPAKSLGYEVGIMHAF